MATDSKQQIFRILIAYDGSAESGRALELAFSVALAVKAGVTVLAVTPLPEPPTAATIGMAIDNAREQFGKVFEAMLRLAADQNVRLETAIAIGRPAEQIIRYAQDSHSDMIVVGRRGTSSYRILGLGSVSERVLQQAPCPVLVAR